MITQKIEQILSEVSKALPDDIQNFKDEIEKNLRASLNATFSKMELVTREEFDIQNSLLQRTRTKLDTLDKKLSELEEQFTKQKTK